MSQHNHTDENPRNPGTDLTSTGPSRSKPTPPPSSAGARPCPAERSIKKVNQAAWLLKAITCIDLTTLSGDDTEDRVRRLCRKARFPVRADLLEALEVQAGTITTRRDLRIPRDGPGRRLRPRRHGHPGSRSLNQFPGRLVSIRSALRKSENRSKPGPRKSIS